MGQSTSVAAEPKRANGPRAADSTVYIAFLGFVVLGLPEGLLGLAWPSMRDTFELPLGAIGAYLLAGTLGFLATSFYSGAVIDRFGAGRTLLVSFSVRGAMFFLIFAAPSWAVIVALSFIIGLATGFIDAGLNGYVARYRSRRLLNWLHACFGLGATLSPVILTGLFEAGLSWRYGYLTISIIHITLACVFVFTLASWKRIAAVPQEGSDAAVPSASVLQSLRLPIVWVGIAIFAVYAGLEVTTGQWAYSLLTEARNITPSTAGLWVSMYWGSFTIGRFAFGVVGDRWPATRLLRGTMAAMLAGALLFWWNPASIASFAGLAILGFALAPVFPILISTTPDRLDERHTSNTIGFQVGAAGIGIAVLPWLGGLLAERASLGADTVFNLSATATLTDRASLEVIGPYLVALVLIIIALHELIVRMGWSYTARANKASIN
jgi:fucose permease